MKKLIAITCLASAVCLTAAAAQADSIKGKVGVTGKLGFLIPADNESDFFNNKTDTGLVGGASLIYGIDDRFAAELEVSRTSFGSQTGDFATTNLSLGAQYRLALSNRQLVPFVGAGVDILFTDYDPYDGSRRDVDTTLGAHLNAGADYFFTRQLALTGEFKLVAASDSDITDASGSRRGSFDPSSFTGTVGVRYFFN
jgi:outer membrane protein